MSDDRDPNVLARKLADALDALADEQAAHARTREERGIVDDHRATLGVVADEARKLATACSRLMARWSEATPEVRERDLWAPMGRALCSLEEWLDRLAREEEF